MLETLTVRVVGVSPLLMHNGQTADPLNKWAKALKEVNSTRKKTDEHYAEIARIEWHAGLYVDDSEKLVLKSDMLDAMIVEGAKKSKLGKQFKAGCWVEDDAPIDIGHRYDKASDLWGVEQFKDTRSVRVNTSRVMRTRPIFRNWSAVVEIHFDSGLLKRNEIIKALQDAGSQVGLGDYRPRFGRFDVVEG